MTYRAWKSEDISAITALEERCFQGEKWSYEMFVSSFEQDGFFGELCEEADALGNDRLFGYACVQSVLGEGDLLNIAVTPEKRGLGIGKTLLSRILQKATEKGLQRMFLEVRQSNESAKFLYQSAGFSVIGERKKYYPDGETAIVMAKELN